MTIKMDWRWWTYFRLESELISAANVEEYDIESKRIKYRREWQFDGEENEASIEATYTEIWINPNKSIALQERDNKSLRDGIKPNSFVKLVDADPKTYFGKPKFLSNYLQPALQKRTANAESNTKD